MAERDEPNAGAIRVRMYRVGFGDCFLVSLPKGKDHAHILVDCGVHSQGNIKTIADAVADVAAQTGGHLDIVVATHPHQDHVSGFASCADTFSKMSVGEVWLPWTENAADKQAKRLRENQLAAISSLTQHFAAVPPEPEVLFMIENLAANDAAMGLLKAGITGGRVRYLEAGQELHEPADIPGLTVKILGPPRDEKFLARMEPPKGDRYFQLGDDGLAKAVNAVDPFGEWAVARKNMPEALCLDPNDESAFRSVAARLDGLAFALDQAVNNSSVVVLFSIRGQHLLFPGDAQYGNWAAWLDQPDSEEILSSLTFLKIAHHGSHNATPRRAIEQLTDNQVASMVSTQNVPWPSIPRKKLLDALSKKTDRWVRSDSIRIPGAPKGPSAKPKKGFHQGGFWYDYNVDL
jgi:beta-lactamase superfamily II metal-dependent hydrolase